MVQRSEPSSQPSAHSILDNDVGSLGVGVERVTSLAARRTLLGLLIFGAASAIGGGVLGVAANGAGVPLEYLHGTIFSSYVIPGMILGLVIGGTQGAAAVAVALRHRLALALASIAGFGMVVWIFVELATLKEYSFLQTIYLALGIGEVFLVLVIAGVFGALRRLNPPAARRSTHI